MFPTAIYRLQSYLLDEDIGVMCCSFRERNLRNKDIVLQVLGGAVRVLNGFNGYNWLESETPKVGIWAPYISTQLIHWNCTPK